MAKKKQEQPNEMPPKQEEPKQPQVKRQIIVQLMDNETMHCAVNPPIERYEMIGILQVLIRQLIG